MTILAIAIFPVAMYVIWLWSLEWKRRRAMRRVDRMLRSMSEQDIREWNRMYLNQYKWWEKQ